MSERVRVNPITCEAHGMCAELLPERITLDEWGYPIVDEEPLPAALLEHARRAAQACPTMAPAERRRRAEGLVQIVTSRDPGDWIDEQLADIRAKARTQRAGTRG